MEVIASTYERHPPTLLWSHCPWEHAQLRSRPAQGDSMTDYDSLQLAIEAVERVRKRQYEVTYYSGLTGSSLFVLISIFAQDKLDSPAFYGTIVYSAFANAIFCVFFQLGLLVALTRARTELAIARRKVALQSSAPMAQLLRDIPPFVYLTALPCGAAGYLTWLSVGKAGWSVFIFGLA